MRFSALGHTWSWPEQDIACRAVVFNWSSDLSIAYEHCKRFDTVVQAGGNMGVWPWLLAKKFANVITFEADPRCWPYLQKNLKGVDNIRIFERGLWSESGTASIHNDEHERRNLGAQYIQTNPAGETKLTTIDSLQLQSCDLIYLDIEGAEMPALRGAVETITRFRPTIVVEDKKLSERFGYAKGDIESWLASEFGYSVKARPHRDVVLAC